MHILSGVIPQPKTSGPQSEPHTPSEARDQDEFDQVFQSEDQTKQKSRERADDRPGEKAVENKLTPKDAPKAQGPTQTTETPDEVVGVEGLPQVSETKLAVAKIGSDIAFAEAKPVETPDTKLQVAVPKTTEEMALSKSPKDAAPDTPKPHDQASIKPMRGETIANPQEVVSGDRVRSDVTAEETETPQPKTVKTSPSDVLAEDIAPKGEVAPPPAKASTEPKTGPLLEGVESQVVPPKNTVEPEKAARAIRRSDDTTTQATQRPLAPYGQPVLRPNAEPNAGQPQKGIELETALVKQHGDQPVDAETAPEQVQSTKLEAPKSQPGTAITAKPLAALPTANSDQGAPIDFSSELSSKPASEASRTNTNYATQLYSGPHAPIASQHAQQVLYQINSAFQSANRNDVEIRLDPEELGKVRMVLMPRDGQMVVQIMAERPETLELLRRNADQLSTDLGSLGYEGASLDFMDQGSSDNDGNDTPAGQSVPASSISPTDTPIPSAPLSTGLSTGLDVRV